MNLIKFVIRTSEEAEITCSRETLGPNPSPPGVPERKGQKDEPLSTHKLD